LKYSRSQSLPTILCEGISSDNLGGCLHCLHSYFDNICAREALVCI